MPAPLGGVPDGAGGAAQPLGLPVGHPHLDGLPRKGRPRQALGVAPVGLSRACRRGGRWGCGSWPWARPCASRPGAPRPGRSRCSRPRRPRGKAAGTPPPARPSRRRGSRGRSPPPPRPSRRPRRTRWWCERAGRSRKQHDTRTWGLPSSFLAARDITGRGRPLFQNRPRLRWVRVISSRRPASSLVREKIGYVCVLIQLSRRAWCLSRTSPQVDGVRVLPLVHPARIKTQTCGVLGRVRFWCLVKKTIPPCPRLRSDWNESPCVSKSIVLKYIGGSDSKCMLLCQRMAVVAASYCAMAIGRMPSWNVSLLECDAQPGLFVPH